MAKKELNDDLFTGGSISDGDKNLKKLKRPSRAKKQKKAFLPTLLR